MSRHIFENVYIWIFCRKLLDIFFGNYKKVAQQIREFGIDRSHSMLDVGCGTGQHSVLTDADYLGIDMDCRYINYARKKYGSARKKFECVKLQDAALNGKKFDVAILIDLLHHIPAEDARDLMSSLAKVTGKYLITFDPVVQSPSNHIGKFLTSHDRGGFIRPKKEHLALFEEYFEIIQAKDGKTHFTESVAVFARPK